MDVHHGLTIIVADTPYIDIAVIAQENQIQNRAPSPMQARRQRNVQDKVSAVRHASCSPLFHRSAVPTFPSTAHRIEIVEADNHNMNHSSLKGSSAERGDLSYMILYACDRRRRTRAHIHIVSQTGVGGWALRHSPYPKAAYVGFQPHVRRNAKNHAKNAYKIVSSGRDARPGVRDRVYGHLSGKVSENGRKTVRV